MCCILNSLIIEGNHKHSQTKVDIFLLIDQTNVAKKVTLTVVNVRNSKRN